MRISYLLIQKIQFVPSMHVLVQTWERLRASKRRASRRRPHISPIMLIVMSLWEVLSHLVDLAVAYARALPISWNREREGPSACIRSFPLWQCCFRLPAGRNQRPRGRFIRPSAYYWTTGIGFIGGGAILKDGTQGS